LKLLHDGSFTDKPRKSLFDWFFINMNGSFVRVLLYVIGGYPNGGSRVSCVAAGGCNRRV